MKIQETLQISKQHYDDVVLKTFIDWCSGYNPTAKGLQEALMSKSLQKYFKHHYSVLETEFKTLIKDYEDLDKKSINEFYAEITNRIFERYPSALIPKISSKDTILNNSN